MSFSTGTLAAVALGGAVGTGLCGALTTWSTLALQATDLARESPARGAAYLGLTLLLGLGAALLTLRLLG